MGRLPRVYIENVLHYVTLKAGHGQNIFLVPADYNEYISLIDKYKTQYGFKLFSFVLLPTHLHLLIEVKNNVPISNIMRDINSLYTKGFNSRHNRKGHLFRERFKTVFVEKKPHLLHLVRHMCLNPQRIKLVFNLKNYSYSGYLQFLDPVKRRYPDMREETEEVFQDLEGGEKAFEEYITNPQEKEINEFKKALRRKRIFGSKDFIEQVKKVIEEDTKARQKRKPLSRKMRIIYGAAAGIIIFISSVAVSYFYRYSLVVKSEYDKTLFLYQDTLKVLKREQEEALKARKDIQNYQWKIKLTEKALEELKAQRDKTLRRGKEIEGYAWTIKLAQVSGPKTSFEGTDIISFSGKRLSSKNMRREKFTSSNYSRSELAGGRVLWETIQSNPKGDVVSWRGEWDGQKMKGVFSWRSAAGVVKDFSFVSIGERVRR